MVETNMEYTQILLLPLLWLFPFTVVVIVNLLFEPAVTLKKSVKQKMINMGVLVFYRWGRRTVMVKKDICPLCKRSGLRCRVTIHPVTGMRSHTSLIANRHRNLNARRYIGWQKVGTILEAKNKI